MNTIIFTMILLFQTNFENYTQPIQGTDINFEMVAVKGGTYYIGYEGGEPDEMPRRNIIVSDFWMAKTETTYDLFQLYLDGTKDPEPRVDAISRPSPPYIDFSLGMGKAGGYPANSMQVYSAIMFCKWFYEKTGIFYRLPTEAEWEYVAQLAYNENQLSDHTYMAEREWTSVNSGNKYHKTATLKPNKLGIHDLLGNVSEWTMDQYQVDYYTKLVDGSADPFVSRSKKHPTTLRGGHYNSDFKDIRPANRFVSDPIWNRRDPQMPKSKWWNTDAPFVGFRLVRPYKFMSKADVELFFEANLK